MRWENCAIPPWCQTIPLPITQEEFGTQFPLSLAMGERVLTENRGSTGAGIWRVSIEDERPCTPGQALPLDTKIKCTEDKDDHVEHRGQLGEFMEFCKQYIVGDNGMLVDMRFLPRIKEAEVRILMVGSEPIFVFHKKPAVGEDAFSATLFSGDKYILGEINCSCVGFTSHLEEGIQGRVAREIIRCIQARQAQEKVPA